MMHLALPTTVADLIAEHDEKAERVSETISEVEDAFTRLGLNTTVRGTYADRVVAKPHLSETQLLANLRKSAWLAAYRHLQIDRLATAKDRKAFDMAMADPPPFTLDNCKATFGDYLVRPRFHVLRGLAEVFTGLDDAYKSHSKVKIGVKGLPKRVILSGWGDYQQWGADKLRDIINALAAVTGKEPVGYISGCDYKLGDTEIPGRGLTLRRFKNGNAHLIFDKWAAIDINQALAEFYGEVLPDVDPTAPTKAPSTAVAKDLQFYWSPPAVVAAALDFADIHPRDYYRRDDRPAIRVLEPSCGDGRIMDELQARGVYSFGIEYDAGRAAIAKAKGHPVHVGNFLEVEPPSDPAKLFDKVVMNPPFYGRHYVKHVRHALRFLKPGGALVAILPASARYDHGDLDDLARGRFRDSWRDLPAGSFADAGTNVPTILLRTFAPERTLA